MKLVFSFVFQLFFVYLSLTKAFFVFADPAEADPSMSSSDSSLPKGTCTAVFSGPPNDEEYSAASQVILDHTKYPQDLMEAHLRVIKFRYGKRIIAILDRLRDKDDEMRAFADSLFSSFIRTGYDDDQSASWETARFLHLQLPEKTFAGCVVFSGTLIVSQVITGNPWISGACSVISGSLAAYLLREREHRREREKKPIRTYFIQTYDTEILESVFEAFEKI